MAPWAARSGGNPWLALGDPSLSALPPLVSTRGSAQGREHDRRTAHLGALLPTRGGLSAVPRRHVGGDALKPARPGPIAKPRRRARIGGARRLAFPHARGDQAAELALYHQLGVNGVIADNADTAVAVREKTFGRPPPGRQRPAAQDVTLGPRGPS
jgi:hypothetical protein